MCWQHDEDEDVSKYENDSRFLFIDVPYKEAKGVCWARNLIQKQYKDQDYILQLDSHHRFVKGWDTILKQKLESLKSKGVSKPVISTYLPSYDPENDPKGRVRENWRLSFDRFLPEGAIFLRPGFIPKNKKHTQSVSSIVFINGNRMLLSECIFNHQPKVGDMILFPHYLMHTAYPFKTKGERRSFSFNLEIDKKIANVFSK